ncbi:MAG: cobalt-precorrin-5B (C(1))-methyltransferase, partial [Nitrospirota bacterium]|nr:cobalt-precorrin-5B (C(1))-methyltransferase [Nitrospirota bacterium]
MASKNKKLRSGYTTGACAAAAAKAAVILAVSGQQSAVRNVEIPFPDGSRVTFKVYSSGFNANDNSAFASVIKDAGDDPDVTNRAEISATVRLIKQQSSRAAEQQDKDKDASALTVKGGEGVGIVTKPGLPIPVGEAAINPVPRRMI